MADLSALIKKLGEKRGALGRVRAERVADEVPEVERQYKTEALEEALDSGYPVTRFDPSKFEHLAASLIDINHGERDWRKELFDKRPWDDIPLLHLLPDNRRGAQVMGHDGRHRMRTLAALAPGERTLLALPRVRTEDFGPVFWPDDWQGTPRFNSSYHRRLEGMLRRLKELKTIDHESGYTRYDPQNYFDPFARGGYVG